jgi:hypothetical protein
VPPLAHSALLRDDPRRLRIYALTSVISSGVRIRFGIFGCELVRKTRITVAVIPRVLAMSRNAGPMAIILGAFSSASTM